MTQEPTPAGDTPSTIVNPFPDAGGMYLLIAGIVLGVLLGPAVLGRLAPSVYENMFIGGTHIAQELADFESQLANEQATLEGIGVTDVAIEEQVLNFESQLMLQKAELQKARRERMDDLTGWTGALMLAVIAVMMIESLISPDVSADKPMRVSPALGRLVTARYALAALWITIVLAQPALLKQLPVLFVALLLVVALAVALVPLGKTRV